MEIIRTGIEGLVVIEPRVFRDERGYFFESFSQREFDAKVFGLETRPECPSGGPESRPEPKGFENKEPETPTNSAETPGKINFVQDNESLSTYGVVRGLHFQREPWAQSKLVRCVKGRVMDVAVDLRKGSPSYGKWYAVELSEENHRQLFIPKGFAHGFSVLSPEAITQYKCDNFYAPGFEAGLYAFDPELGIDWGLPPEAVILSEKDKLHPRLKEFIKSVPQ